MRKLVLFFALLALLITPSALAHHKDSHSNGPQSDSKTCESYDDGDNAHPSGKDRSCESGVNSGPEEDGDNDHQGNSDSDPDDNTNGPDRSNGGPDKPGGTGGVDKDDQDGNNGCGNDDDFEDDNEGWCGGKPTTEPTPVPTPTVTPDCEDLGTCPTPTPTETVTPSPSVSPSVLPTCYGDGCDGIELDTDRVERGDEVEGSSLPVTGRNAIVWILVAAFFVVLGLMLIRRR